MMEIEMKLRGHVLSIKQKQIVLRWLNNNRIANLELSAQEEARLVDELAEHECPIPKEGWTFAEENLLVEIEEILDEPMRKGADEHMITMPIPRIGRVVKAVIASEFLYDALRPYLTSPLGTLSEVQGDEKIKTSIEKIFNELKTAE